MSKNEIDKLIYYFSKLPGFGQRSSRRIALHLMNNKDTLMLPLAESLSETAAKIKECQECGNIDISSPCHICANSNRDKSTICIVETIADLWAFERSSIYKGIYHVLGGTLSSYDKRGPKQLNIDKIVNQCSEGKFKEIIIATNATLEGQTTAFYISEKLENMQVKVSRLAYGIPLGGELDYLDDGTLSAAFEARKPFTDNVS